MFPVAVNNAGNSVYANTFDHTKEQIEELFSTNLFRAIYIADQTYLL